MIKIRDLTDQNLKMRVMNKKIKIKINGHIRIYKTPLTKQDKKYIKQCFLKGLLYEK